MSAHDDVCQRILNRMIAQFMTEDVYLALQADLGCGVGLGSDGSFLIRIHGLNDKLPNLLKTILPHISNACDRLEEGMFDELLRNIEKDYFNSMIDPGDLAYGIQMSVLDQTYKTSVDLHGTCNSITFESFKSFSTHCLKSFLFVKGLVQGNMNEEQASQMYDNVVSQMITKTASKFSDNDLEPEFRNIEEGDSRLSLIHI